MIYVYKMRSVQVGLQCGNSYSGVKIGESENDIRI